jgi:plasmid stabilization system protein ParE
MSFGYELISETDRLQAFPELGRIVPEYRNDHIREIVFRPYRIVYRVDAFPCLATVLDLLRRPEARQFASRTESVH